MPITTSDSIVIQDTGRIEGVLRYDNPNINVSYSINADRGDEIPVFVSFTDDTGFVVASTSTVLDISDLEAVDPDCADYIKRLSNTIEEVIKDNLSALSDNTGKTIVFTAKV